MANNTFEIIKKIYKPYRYTKKGKTTIIETTEGKFIVKEKSDNNIKELQNYLISRNFDNFPKIIDESRSELNIYEYVDEIHTPNEQKMLDLVDVVSNLHNKTTYFKETSEDKYKSIYEDIDNNINYLNNYYESLFSLINKETYMSPSHYILMRNYSEIMAALSFSKRELDLWLELVTDSKKQRVSVIHNNLKVEHLIKGSKDYLISWENSRVDTPILDLINLYDNEYMDYDFEEVFNRYLRKYELNQDEKKLLFIILSIPKKVELSNNEFINTKNCSNVMDYIFKTESLIRPYYSEKKEEE